MKKLLWLVGPDVAAARSDMLFQDRERSGWSPRIPIRFAAVGVFLAVFAATGTSAFSAEWKNISPEDANIVFHADEVGMKLRNMLFLRDIDSELERGYWTAPNGGFPRLILLLQSLGSYVYFSEGMFPIRDIIAKNKDFQKRGVEYGEKGFIDNVLGRAEYETYRSGILHCFLIKQYAGDESLEIGGRNKVLFGYYCDATPTATSVNIIRSVLSRIGIKGEGVPPKQK